jgi:hypothetical protein
MANEVGGDTAKSKTPKPFKFTDGNVGRLTVPPGERQIYRSQVLQPGLSLRITVGKRRKTFYASYYRDGRTVQERIGDWGDFDCKDAADKARELFKYPERRDRERSAGMFPDVATKWFKANVEGKQRCAHEVKRVLTKDLACWEFTPFAQCPQRPTDGSPRPDA